MHLRALRLLPFQTSTSSEAITLSFVSTLQLAAGRAWSRRVTALSPRPGGIRMRSNLANNDSKMPVQSGPSVTKRAEHRAILVPPISERKGHIQRETSTIRKPHTFRRPVSPIRYNRSSVNVTVPQTHKQGRTPLVVIPPHAEVSNTFYKEPVPPKDPHSVDPDLPYGKYPISHPPKTATVLHQNLLYLINIRKPVCRLPVILDYHTLYPNLQSTASYNLLISLSLRHGSPGTTHQLFTRLEMANIPKDTETYRLIIRWFISRGLWNNAWNFVQDLKKRRKISQDIPYRLWLEFCRFPKPRIRRRFVNNDEGQLIRTYFERVEDKIEDIQIRKELLFRNRPKRVPTLANTTPFAIYCLVQLLVKTNNRDRALALTKAYFKAMPQSIDRRNVMWCLNVIHVLMASCRLKEGLPKFYEARKLMVYLLKLHPRLRPDSRSMYLLLAPLRRAKHCGTIAWKVLRHYRACWGKELEDRRVQRRVVQLALKEGRMDVVKRFVLLDVPSGRDRWQRLARLRKASRLRTAPPLSQTSLTSREFYFREGQEARYWVRLKMRASKAVKKRAMV